jgi:disulfide bond formation protein DsbB|tara:strand:- start:128219 stop:128728 length:510 start_codon:yes stop_codon:yes gene_type:complete
MKRLFRIEQGILALLAMLVLMLSYYLQYVKDLEPCPLCLMQRFMMFGLLFFAIIGVFGYTRRRACVLILSELLLTAGGLLFALRQVWLQSLPVADTGMCLPGIEALIHKLPWQDVVHAFIWGGSTGCGEVDWTFAGFSMPAWSAVYFGMIGLVSVFFLIRLCKHDRISD